MPILSVFFGMIVRMWHDDHPPPYDHVEHHGLVAQVRIETEEIMWEQLPKKAAAIVREWCLKHLYELFDTGSEPRNLSRSNEFRGAIMMISLLCSLNKANP